MNFLKYISTWENFGIEWIIDPELRFRPPPRPHSFLVSNRLVLESTSMISMSLHWFCEGDFLATISSASSCAIGAFAQWPVLDSKCSIISKKCQVGDYLLHYNSTFFLSLLFISMFILLGYKKTSQHENCQMKIGSFIWMKNTMCLKKRSKKKKLH